MADDAGRRRRRRAPPRAYPKCPEAAASGDPDRVESWLLACERGSAGSIAGIAASPGGAGAAKVERALFLLVPSSSDAADELNASFLGIAQETVLAGIVPIQPPASVAPTAVRAGEGEVVNLRHLNSVTARPPRCRSSRNEASRNSAGRRPTGKPGPMRIGAAPLSPSLRRSRGRPCHPRTRGQARPGWPTVARPRRSGAGSRWLTRVSGCRPRRSGQAPGSRTTTFDSEGKCRAGGLCGLVVLGARRATVNV